MTQALTLLAKILPGLDLPGDQISSLLIIVTFLLKQSQFLQNKIKYVLSSDSRLNVYRFQNELLRACLVELSLILIL